jgi:hypothetical protein
MPQINTLLNVQEALGKRRPFRIRYIGVAGGGGAASASLSDPIMGAGGGGGGGVITGSYIPEKDSVYPIVVGNGGAPETNGVDTVLFDTTAIGGGAGKRSNETGSNGGSGGGGGFGGIGLQPTASYTGEAIDEKYFKQFGNDGGGITQPNFEVEFLAVAGGGGGSQADSLGNGGGGGGVITGSFLPSVLQTYDIIVGNGGAPSNANTGFTGQNSALFGAIALGGGGAVRLGAGDIPPLQVRNGGSGGGINSGDIPGVGLQPTASYPGFGNDGGTSVSVGGVGGAGGGGGAGAAGSGQNGGNGIALDFTGTTVLYGPGGAGNQINALGSVGSGIYGVGGNGGFSQTAGSQLPRNATSGSAGIAIIKYAGEPKAIGGTITQSGGYTYHTYSTVGTGSFNILNSAGGGGGAGQTGFNSDSFIGGDGGDGIEVDMYLTLLKYGPGGAGFSIPSGSGNDGEGIYGAGGTAGLTAESGSAGVAIIKYEGAAPRATGGIITQDTRYIYHLFETGSADFTWLG